MKWFHRIRWISMAIWFCFFCWGIHLTGEVYSKVFLPVFACPQNTDMPVGSYCYDLSHFTTLLQNDTTKEIGIFLGIFVAFSMVFGRFFCGFVCPMGFFQDIIAKCRYILHMDGINRKDKLVETLRTIKYVILLVFLLGIFIKIDFCKICPAAVTTQTFAGFNEAFTVGYFICVGVFILSFFMRRFWCNICPLGFLIGIFHKIALVRIKKDVTACTQCGACYAACPMKIKEIYVQDKKSDVTTSDCIFCGECVKVCPEDEAIAISFLHIKFYVASRADFYNLQRGNGKWQTKEKNRFKKDSNKGI